MKSTSCNISACIVFLICLGSGALQAQSPYFQAVTNLNPLGYWPMHETGSPAPGSIETNLGTLGALGMGYYSDWENNNLATTKVVHGIRGALGNDSDSSVFFMAPGAGGA